MKERPKTDLISPLLSNIVLDKFDRELERRGLRFARYADDCNIYVRSRRARERVMKSVTRFPTTKLQLKVNEQKSAVARPWERKFLGFSFTWNLTPKRRIAPSEHREDGRRTGPLFTGLDRLLWQLRHRGVGKDLAAQTAGSAHGPWHLANSPAPAIALPNAYFASLGIPPLAERR